MFQINLSMLQPLMNFLLKLKSGGMSVDCNIGMDYLRSSNIIRSTAGEFTGEAAC